jgi:hypothetical protein
LAESGFSLLKSAGTVLAPLSLPVRDSPTKPLALAPPPLEYNIASDGKQASLSLIKYISTVSEISHNPWLPSFQFDIPTERSSDPST